MRQTSLCNITSPAHKTPAAPFAYRWLYVCACNRCKGVCVFVSGRRQGQAVGDRAQLAQLLTASK